jgi:HPt (histidine-containing phosphotransfer) domain-containing protein
MVDLEQKVIRERRAMELKDLLKNTADSGRGIYNLHIFPMFDPNGNVEGTGGLITDAAEKPVLDPAAMETETKTEAEAQTQSTAKPDPSSWDTVAPALPKAEADPDEPILDEKMMKLSFGNNDALLKKSMEIYLKDAPNLIDDIDAAIKAEDFKQASALAHALKGISSYYTKSGPFELARLLDLAAQKPLSPEMKTVINNLGTALSRAVSALSSAMNERLGDTGR